MTQIIRKITGLILIISMLICTAAVPSFAFTEGNGFDAEKCTNNETAKSGIRYLKYKYPNKTVFPKGGTCFGYATDINDLLAGKNSETEYKGLRFTKKKFLKLCKGVKAGTHIRFSDSKTYNGGYGHSVVLFKVTDDIVYFADNNYYSYNTVCYNRCSVDEFCSYYDYKYINRITVPKKYRTFTTSLVSGKALKSGAIRLRWIKTTDTQTYCIYRSNKKKSGYKKIAEVTDTTYLDKTADRNSKVYYKVKSVRNGRNTTSDVLCIKTK